MTSLAKLIASIAALIASLALAWIAREGVEIRHKGDIYARISGYASPRLQIELDSPPGGLEIMQHVDR
jgi:hypothetical protein